MVEGARLESVYTPKGYREFESRRLRLSCCKSMQYDENQHKFALADKNGMLKKARKRTISV